MVEVTTVQAAASERVLIMEAQAAGVATASVGLQVNFSPCQRNLIKKNQNEAKLVQLNKYETAPHFIQLTKNLTSDCWLI